MAPEFLDYIQAHRKALLALVAAVLVFVVDAESADRIIVAVNAVLILIVPNDQAAVARIYRR